MKFLEPMSTKALEQLAIEFEAMSQKGTVVFLEETVFLQLIAYYEQRRIRNLALVASEYGITQHPFSADLYFKKAVLLLQLNELDEALVTLDEAEKFSPADLQLRLLRADLLSLKGKFFAALDILQDLEPQYNAADLADIYFAQAQIYENMREYDEHFKSLRRALLANPRHQEAHIKLLLETERSQRYEATIKLQRRLTTLDPYAAWAWCNLGNALGFLGNYEEAIEAYEFAYSIEEGFEFAYRNCADLHLEQHNFKNALYCYQLAEQHFDLDAEALIQKGLCFKYLNNLSDALACFERAISLEEHNEDALFECGNTWAILLDWKKAAKYYLEAIKINNKREDFWAALGAVRHAQGQQREAEACLRRALHLAPDDVHYWLIFIHYLLLAKKPKQALKAIQEAENQYGEAVNLSYSKIACLFEMAQRQQALDLLANTLQTNLGGYELLFDLCPTLKDDKTVIALIDCFK